MTIQCYRDLEVWQKSIKLVKACYMLSDQFPKNETYGLASQLRRAAVSIAANIAEGRSRSSTREFLRFADIAYGSLSETETHLIIAQELRYLSTEQVEPVLIMCAEIGRMLNGLMNSLRRKLQPDPRSPVLDPIDP